MLIRRLVVHAQRFASSARGVHTSFPRTIATACSATAGAVGTVGWVLSARATSAICEPVLSHGLTNPTCNDEFYASELQKAVEEVEHFTKRGVFWEAAEEDARTLGMGTMEYLAAIEAKIALLFESDEVFDRVELVAALKKSLSSKGTLTLVLGGKSLCKSKVQCIFLLERFSVFFVSTTLCTYHHRWSTPLPRT
jgi:hypothetical protein